LEVVEVTSQVGVFGVDVLRVGVFEVDVLKVGVFGVDILIMTVGGIEDVRTTTVRGPFTFTLTFVLVLRCRIESDHCAP
jgi:hypothetical protein